MPRRLAMIALAALGCESAAMPDAATSAWSLGPELPRPALAAGVAALGLRVVVAGGFDTAPDATGAAHVTAEVDEFDLAVNRWRTLPDAPVRWVDLNLATVGSTLYIAGGLDGASRAAHGEVFALDPIRARWEQIPSLPRGEERGGAGVVGSADRLFLLGGVSSSAALASCVELDVATRTWRALPPLPEPRAHPAAMRRSDGWLIVAGGFASLDASQPRSDVWGLPPLGTAWQPLAAMHLPGETDARGGCAYGVVLGQLTCAGGSGPGALRVVESYEPFLDVWTLREPMPVERAGTRGASAAGRLFVPGGADAVTGQPTRTMLVYAPIDTAPRRGGPR